MQTNGTIGEPFAKLAEIARPLSWGTALERCRKAKLWSQKQLIAEALQGENVGVNDVKRWELAKDWPTLNQCNKLRTALPDLRGFEDLIRFDLRELKASKSAPKAPLSPKGWEGPPVKDFGEALRWVRLQHGMSQAELSKVVGVASMAPWERGAVMVRGTYERLCEILPELRMAPLPKFSAKFQNQIRTKGFLESEELHQEAARATRALAPVAPIAPPPPPVPKGPDPAHLNQAGANYGTLVANVLALQNKKEAMEKRHMEESLIMEAEIQRAEALVKEADEHMRTAAKAMHLPRNA